MMRGKLFYKDSTELLSVSYSQLLQDIIETDFFKPFCKSHSFYDIFRSIIVSLLVDKEIVLLDSDFSDVEIEKLIGTLSLLDQEVSVDIPHGISEENLAGFIRQNVSSWRITLFTSGTTGLPKRVSHTFESITRFVRSGDKHQNDVWGFAYNPTHMAGLQVFFQALLNLNPMIRLFGLEKKTIVHEIRENSIKNI